MTRRDLRPTPRVTAAAHEAWLGGWERSEVVNARDPAMWFICGFGAPVLAAQVVVPLVIIGREALGPSGAPVFGWALISAGALIGLTAVLVAVALLQAAIGLARRGRLLVHCYTQGLVLERTTGRVLAAPYSAVSAVLLEFENSSESSGARTGSWIQPIVLLTLPDASTCAIDEPRGYDLATLLAARCSAPVARRITVSEAVDLQSDHAWA